MYNTDRRFKIPDKVYSVFVGDVSNSFLNPFVMFSPYRINSARSRLHKGTFCHEHPTFQQYMATWWWNDARHDVDPKGRELDTHDETRSMLSLRLSSAMSPMRNIILSKGGGWRWEEEQPEWLDEEDEASYKVYNLFNTLIDFETRELCSEPY